MKKFIIAFIISIPTLAVAQANTGNPIELWNAGTPLPKMPDLKKPVFLEKGAFICVSPGPLVNPSEENIKIALYTETCALSNKRKRVMVHPPRNAQSYSEAYYGGYIKISLTSGNVSDGNIDYLWTLPEYLKN